MLFKVIAQFLVAVSLVQIMPVDASILEYRAGQGSTEQAVMNNQELDFAYASLPVAQNRQYPMKVNVDSYGIVTTAYSALVVDDASGAVLFEKHPDALRSIGSVTKLMTVLVFLEQNSDLNQIVSLDPSLDFIGGGMVYLGYFNGVSLRDVLGASLVGSDNTATESLVRFSGLSQEDFLSRMNAKADELGMVQTDFYDFTGIDANNMSTANELVLLLKEAEANKIMSYFMQQPTYTITQASGRSVTIQNTNGVLQSFINQAPYDVIGGKTGYLPQAGYVLITTVENNGNRVHVVVMGAESKTARVNEAKGLAYWAFKTFQWPEK
ncbi:serine hydrolase [Patescibacteria group bacterium]|nr:serine hydrolase [Patescibacteria group bacterium]MBU4453209.1 serine hydrolase [Patescibacteria group bacterium]MCG2687610.1 serine hydrolase [Candidatus Parcubacteria bacterium]